MAGLQKAIAQLMEGRQQERPPHRPDEPGLTPLLARLRERVPADDRETADAFARELFAKARALLVEAQDLAPLVAMTASAFGFLRDRGNQPLALRVFTPRAERDGWSSPLTVIESALDDRPFIVDTLCAAIEGEGGELRQLFHPVLGVARDSDGRLSRLGPPDEGVARESFFHAEVASLPATAGLQQRLTERVRQVMVATDDYPAMRAQVAAIAAALRAGRAPAPWEEERDEVAAMLDWLAQKSFVYLGYREYDLRGGERPEALVRRGSGLGLLRDEARSRYREAGALPLEVARRLNAPPLLLVSKTHAPSPVHRRVPMDDITIKEVDAGGRVVGARRLLGLFTSKAYSDAASELPVLRRRLAALLRRAGVVEGSHDYRDLVDLFNSFPREELFASSVEDIHEAMREIVGAEGGAGIHVHSRPDALRRGLFALVLLPRARFSTELHGRISAALRRQLHATVLHEHLALDDRSVARLHYFCAVEPAIAAEPPLAALQADLATLLRTWDDELGDALGRVHGRPETERLVGRYGRAFPAAYKATVEVGEAVADVHRLEALVTSGAAQIELTPPRREGAAPALKLYLGDELLVLSEFVPVLENLGFRVLGQDVIELKLPELARASIHVFSVEPSGATRPELDRVAPLAVAALHAVREGRADDDRLNRLVTAAALDWRAVDLLRAYVDHARQIGVGTRATLIEALTGNPASAAHLFELFAARFDPAATPLAAAERAAGPVAALHARLLTGLDAVQSLSHDRILRALAAAVMATVRTNFYTAADGAAIALKLDPAQLPHLAAPRPGIETWVHGRGVQGIHLRAGRVARGGIRASDRPDDFRAEVLGLMRTQVVKNAVIVPVGAKGGFIVRGLPPGAPADAARVEAAYRAFIEALLSITDNLDHGQVVPPPGQLIYDGPDPYLVVAADKGTATFSDVANELALRRGFWLGDAFASGGSQGYDHKRLAITARGAWECARQHFREMGRDLDRETVIVAGIGDMSGDVFGNGLLRSSHLRLLAAFNHRHVFIDPDPDPELSYRERARLFALPRSGWNDYAPAALSRGGGVYERAAKAIPLTAAARALLQLEAEAPSGEEVVRAILRLPVDLLWNGGVGTYVKASDETHAEVADPGNDALRIDARELRAAVVAEGGNLGLTQRARIEYALGGGRINTDAIDNSGGVDCSDHEVNLKIALQPLVAARELSGAERDALLAELAEPVCEAVLEHNRGQALALGLDQLRSRTQLAAFRDLMSILEAEAGLDRQLAQLPTRETLRARRGVYRGLTRPELAVLLANTKLDLERRLLQSPLCDDPALEADLQAYFPAALAQRFPGAVLHHPLRREIIAVQLANALVDRMGVTFLVHAVRDTGRDVIEVVRAWAAARAVTGAEPIAAALAMPSGTVLAEPHAGCAQALAGALEQATVWVVETQPPDEPLAALIERLRGPVAELLADWPARLDAAGQHAHASRVETATAAGLDADAAASLARLAAVEEALEISQIAADTAAPLAIAADAYAAVARLVDLDWVRRALPGTLAGEDRWEQRAIAGLLEGLRYARRQLTLDVLGQRRGGSVDEGLAAYGEHRREQLDVVASLIADLKAASQPSLPALLVVMREVGRLARPAHT